MSSFFALLFLASLGLLAWGIISPKSLSRFSNKPMARKEAVLVFGVGAVVMLVLTGVTAPNLSTDTKQPTSELKKLSETKVEEVVPLPVIETKKETKTEDIPFSKSSVQDSSRKKGTSAVTVAGKAGVKTYIYDVTYSDGKETGRKLVSEQVTVQPITEVTSIGTKEVIVRQSNCDPNYGGGCVPIASDVDCAGGSGNGPAYVRGPVTVVGSDIYDLDRDGDGYGCE